MLRKSPSKLRCERFSSKHLNVKVKKNCALKYNSMQFSYVFFSYFSSFRCIKNPHIHETHRRTWNSKQNGNMYNKVERTMPIVFFSCVVAIAAVAELFFFQKIIFGVGFFFFSLSRYFGTFIAVNTHIIIVCRCFFFCCSCWCYFVCWRS